MELYIVLILLLAGCCLIENRKAKGVFFYICCAYFLVLACFRDASVGIDHTGYIRASLGLETRFEEKARIEIVWGFLNTILKRIQIAPLFTIVTSLLTLIPLFAIIKKESPNKFFSLLLFLLIPYGFCFSLTGIRQSISAVILLWAFYFLSRRKFIHTAILILVSVGIHVSSLAGLIAIPFIFIKIEKKIFYILILASAAIGFIFQYNIYDLLGAITPFVEFLSFYEGYGTYHADEMMNINGLISVIVPPTVFALLAVKDDRVDNLYVKLFCVGVIGTNIFANVPMIGRYFMYFTLFQILLVPYSFKKSKFMYKVGILVTIAYMLLYFYLFIPEATETLKYKFFF